MAEQDNNFYQLLVDIESRAGDSFTGIGLIYYDTLDHLPFMQTGDVANAGLPVVGWEKIVLALLAVSHDNHPAHDGFHAISADGHLTHLSLYIAPSISNHEIDDFRYGSRYYTSKFAADHQGIIATAVISKNYGIRYFTRQSGS